PRTKLFPYTTLFRSFQKRKLNALFNLYDVNQDGFVEQADFEHIVQNLATIQGFQPDSSGYTRLSANHMAVWHNIQQLSGAPGSQDRKSTRLNSSHSQ